MTGLKLKFQAQTNNNSITGISVELNECALSSIEYAITELNKKNYGIPATIKIDGSFLLKESFISWMLNIKNKNTLYFEFELSDDINKENLIKLKRNITKIKKNGFLTCLHYSENNKHDSELKYFRFDQVKFNSKLTQGIDKQYQKFKYLKYLNDIVVANGVESVVFEGIDELKAQELTVLINNKSSVQGLVNKSFFNLTELFDSYSIACEKLKCCCRKDSEWLAYKHITSNYQPGLIGNCLKIKPEFIDETKKFPYHQSGFNNVDNPEFDFFIFNILKNSDKMFALRNSDGVVLFENNNHEKFFGRSLVGLPFKDVVDILPDYSYCIDDDRNLLNSPEMFSVKKELVNYKLYFTIRQKITFEKHTFIAVTVYEESKGLYISRDPLTGCLSRDSINSIEKSVFYEDKVVAFIDLNGFKLINDNLGHDVGDDVLVEFCSLMQSYIRIDTNEDIIVRYGGDEFILFFNTNDLEHIDSKLKYINTRVKKYFESKNITLSFSHGLSINNANDINETIKNADATMYLAKKAYKGII